MRHLAVAPLLVALALGAAGCGGGGDRTPVAGGATTGAPGPPARDRARPAAAGDGDPWTPLQALAAVAARTGGTRAAGTPGGVATENMVAAWLKVAGMDVHYERVRFPFFDERRPPLLALPRGRRLRADTDVRTLAYSAGGDVRARVHVVGDGRPDAGCRASDWGRFPRGRIALVRRGVCPFARKARAAQRAGAAAVLIDDRAATGARGPVSGTLGAPGVGIAVVAVDAAAGAALRAARGAIRVRVDAVSGQRVARNVIGERLGTDRGRVVMAGAHLDSVPAGPGINDDGSGVATLLALAVRVGRAPRLAATVRLGFWTAEELGLYGSRAYVRRLSAAERRRIAGYVNLDMVGSPNAVLETYGSGATEAALRRALAARGPAPNRSSIGGASDHASFQRAGIEVGGIFTGASGRVSRASAERFGARAGRPADPCYHQACDTLRNVNRAMLERVADAVDVAVRRLAG